MPRGFSGVGYSQTIVAPVQSRRPSIVTRLSVHGSAGPEAADEPDAPADVGLVQAQGVGAGIVQRGVAGVEDAADRGSPEVDLAARGGEAAQLDVAVDDRRLRGEAEAAVGGAEARPVRARACREWSPR